MATAPHARTLYEALEALPEGVTGEIVDGQLYAMPRPSGRHGLATSNINVDVGNAYSRGRGGPGGWWIIVEPEVHFVRDRELVVPDLAGWRRSRMPDVPDDQRFEVVPDWVCEVASKSTASYDRNVKMPLYARYRVRHAWLVDVVARRLETYALDGDRWREIGTFDGGSPIRVAPFDEVEIAPPWE